MESLNAGRTEMPNQALRQTVPPSCSCLHQIFAGRQKTVFSVKIFHSQILYYTWCIDSAEANNLFTVITAQRKIHIEQDGQMGFSKIKHKPITLMFLLQKNDYGLVNQENKP